ncbi:MAG: hypothetical protein H7338_10155 [Candidatus Sericytochromatia bacterium]|nr:hypothetical protein [Candidatus Sericytochromatia bacterium]
MSVAPNDPSLAGLTADIRRHSQRFGMAIQDQLKEITGLSERYLLLAGNEMTQVHQESAYQTDTMNTIRQRVTESKAELDSIQAEEVQSVGSFLATIDDFCQGQAELAKAAEACTATVLKEAKGIKLLADSARMLAINARIEASHIGDAGRTFGIIADEIQKWSARIEVANQTISSLGKNLTEILPKIASETDQMTAGARQGSEILRQSLTDVETSQQRSQEAILTALDDGTARAQAIQERCHQVLSHLQFQDYLVRMVANVERQADRQGQSFEDLLTYISDLPEGMSLAAAKIAIASQSLSILADYVAAGVDIVGDSAGTDDEINFF